MITEDFAVIDFETTGLSADYCRVIEVAVAIVEKGEITDSFTQLMHPGCRLPSFITNLTGITENMLKGKPKPEVVMPQVKEFIGDRFCVAHNATFDAGFYHSEMRRTGISHERDFLCTVKLSRRLIHNSPNYQLGTLARHLNLPTPEELNSHRALHDVLLTVELWKHIGGVVRERIGGREASFEIYKTIMKKPKSAIQKYFDKLVLN